jgi:hypothetical protein
VAKANGHARKEPGRKLAKSPLDRIKWMKLVAMHPKLSGASAKAAKRGGAP